MITKEKQAGELYSAGRKAVRAGGLELQSLAMHMTLMIDGTGDFKGPLWPVRELSDGRLIQLDRFIDYLLRPAREGLELPSLYFLKQALEATPEDGDRALGLVRRELAKENVDFDAQAKRDELKLHGDRPEANDPGHPMSSKGDNIPVGTKSHRGTSAAHLAARLKRDHPKIAAQLADGKFKSVRAAAIEAGIIKPPTRLDRLCKEWEAASEEVQQEFCDRYSLRRR